MTPAQARSVAMAWAMGSRPYGLGTFQAELYRACKAKIDFALKIGDARFPHVHPTTGSALPYTKVQKEHAATRRGWLVALIAACLMNPGPEALDVAYRLSGIRGVDAVVIARLDELEQQPDPDPIEARDAFAPDADDPYANGYLDSLTYLERLLVIAGEEPLP